MANLLVPLHDKRPGLLFAVSGRFLVKSYCIYGIQAAGLICRQNPEQHPTSHSPNDTDGYALDGMNQFWQQRMDNRKNAHGDDTTGQTSQ